jgi:hypothetical protein
MCKKVYLSERALSDDLYSPEVVETQPSPPEAEERRFCAA